MLYELMFYDGANTNSQYVFTYLLYVDIVRAKFTRIYHHLARTHSSPLLAHLAAQNSVMRHDSTKRHHVSHHFIIVQTYLKTLNLWNACQIYFVEYVSMIKHILTVIHYTVYGAVCFQFTHISCDDWDNVHFVLLSSSNRKYELLSIV